VLLIRVSYSFNDVASEKKKRGIRMKLAASLPAHVLPIMQAWLTKEDASNRLKKKKRVGGIVDRCTCRAQTVAALKLRPFGVGG
jgi:hypothetical protein